MLNAITTSRDIDDGNTVFTASYGGGDIDVVVSEWGYPLWVSIEESMRDWGAEHLSDGVLLVYKKALATALDYQAQR